ncbi:hypothetical protein D3C86_1417630 [compost metagenome]
MRQQRRLEISRLDVFRDGFRFAQRPGIGDDVGHLAERRRRQVGFADPGQHFLEWQVFFQQRQLDLVVVIAGGKAAELQHVVSLRY